MNPPQVYMCSPSWTLLPPPSPFHPSGSSGLPCYLGFSLVVKRVLLSSCSVWASHCSDFSCWGAWALGRVGFSNCSSWAQAQKLQHKGLVTPQHVGSFWIRDWTHGLLSWQADSLPLSHREAYVFLINTFNAINFSLGIT